MLKSPCITTRDFLRARENDRPASIITTSSISSYAFALRYSSYYTVKTALNRLIEFVAYENKDHGVQCVAFHPVGVKKELTAQSSAVM